MNDLKLGVVDFFNSFRRSKTAKISHPAVILILTICKKICGSSCSAKVAITIPPSPNFLFCGLRGLSWFSDSESGVCSVFAEKSECRFRIRRVFFSGQMRPFMCKNIGDLRRINIRRKINFRSENTENKRVGVKERIRAILHYKKPTFWMIFAAVILCAVTAVRS